MQLKIGRLRGGLCVYWTDADGNRHRHRLKARTRAEAEPEALDVYRQKTFDAGRACTVGGAWEAYALSLAGRPTAKTLGYTGVSVLRHFGHYRPDQITRDLCLDYAEGREREGKSQGTIHTELGHLRSALRYAAKTGLIDRAPHIWRPEKPAPREVFLSRNEMIALIDATHAPHMRVAITLLAGTAARVGAVLDLTWDRVDFQNGHINLRLEDAKTRKGRAIVPMNQMVRTTMLSAKEAALSDFVVEYAGGQVGSIRTAFNAAKRRAGLDGYTIHDVRRSAARFMAEAGIDMELIASMLGHSNVAVTRSTYARFSPGYLQGAADVLDFGTLRSVK